MDNSNLLVAAGRPGIAVVVHVLPAGLADSHGRDPEPGPDYHALRTARRLLACVAADISTRCTTTTLSWQRLIVNLAVKGYLEYR